MGDPARLPAWGPQARRSGRQAWTDALRVVAPALALCAYLGLVGWRGALLVAHGSPSAVLLGLAVLVFPVLGAWVLWRELSFGFAAQAVSRLTFSASGPAHDHGSTGPAPADATAAGRRHRREQAMVDFVGASADVQAAPGDFRAWCRLAVVYDGAGDRRRARSAMRRAISLHRSDQQAGG